MKTTYLHKSGEYDVYELMLPQSMKDFSDQVVKTMLINQIGKDLVVSSRFIYQKPHLEVITTTEKRLYIIYQ